MAFTIVPVPPNEYARKQQVASWVVSLKQHSEQHHWVYRRTLPATYDLYRGIRTHRYHVHKNAINVPLLYTITWSHAARIMNMVFGQNPPIRFMGATDDPQDIKIARKHDNLFAAQFRDARGMEKLLDVITNANLYGPSIIQHGWKFEKSKVLVPSVASMPLSEQVGQALSERDQVFFDGPWFELIDNLDAYPQPGFKHINDMRWFIRRYWLDLSQVEALTRTDDAREPIFDPYEVMRMKSESSGAQASIDNLKVMRGLSYFQQDDETARLRERYSKPVEIIEAFGIHVPSELLPAGDSATFRLLTVANNRYLLRDKAFPLMLNRRPYLAMSFNPDMHYFFAPGRGEMVKKMQIGVNKITNNVLDALDVSIDPWFIFDRAAGIDPRNLFLRPGRWIPVNGPPSERIMPGQTNLSGLNAGIEISQLLWSYMQRVSGILDESVIGIRAPGRSTARGDLSRSESVAVRLVLEAMLFERQMLEPLADAFMAHNKQFLSAPREFAILGDSMKFDSITGEPMPVGRDILMPGDLIPTYVARAIGTQARQVRSGRMQDLLLLTQIMNQSEGTAQYAANVNWLRLVGRELGLGPEVNEAIEAAGQGTGFNPQNVPNLNLKEGAPGIVGNFNNAMSQLTG